MQLIKYIRRNIFRNKLRNILTMLSIAFSLTLMTALYGFNAMMNFGGETNSNRVVVMSSQGFAGRVPISMIEYVRRLPDVKSAVPFSWFGGNYEDQEMAFSQFGTDPKEAFNVWDDYKISPEQLEAFNNNRRACVADRRLAERMKWQIGDRIPLVGTFYPVSLDLELVGLFDAPANTDSLWFNWTYLDESLRTATSGAISGNAAMIYVNTKDGDRIPDVIKAIDHRYASSDTPTRSTTEAAFLKIFADMIGNFKALIFYIGVAVVFSLALVAASAMAMSMRERTTEMAVLKAIGFSKLRVLLLVLGEACVIALLGGLAGIAMGCLLLEGAHNSVSQYVPLSIMQTAGVWLAYLALTALGIGLVSGIVPAIRAANLSVIDGLRRVI
jgi:putative ABC transport system permease protein